MGPRAAGKTTTARRHVHTVVRLDRAAEAAAFAADPDVALAELDEPALLDEWQLVPAVLGAVKRAVDDDPRPRRFILTGSVRAELSAPGWPGTGRLVRVPLWGLAERELAHRAGVETSIDVMFEGALERLSEPRDPPNLRDYCELALRGGFPQVVVQSSAAIRRRWLDAGVVEHKTLYDAAGINRMTAIAYDGLLESLFVVDRLDTRAVSSRCRSTRPPRRYVHACADSCRARVVEDSCGSPSATRAWSP